MDKLLKSIQFQGDKVEIDERKLMGRHEPAKTYLVDELTPLGIGDFKVFDLSDEHKLTVMVRDRGLYSGHITKSDGDIVHYIQPGLVDGILNNLEAKHLRLAKAPVAEPSVSVPVGSGITVNINIQKAIDELCNLSKADKLPGGKADKKKPEDFDSDALAEGIKHELEHTNDKSIAQEIAMDHLTEDKDYYKKLAQIEKSNELRKAKDMDKCDYSMKKKAYKAAPEGVDEAKYKRCKEQVEAKQGGKVNAYAVCAASLQRAMKSEEGKKKLGKVFDLLDVSNFMDKSKVRKAHSILAEMLKVRVENPEHIAKAILDMGMPTNYLFNMVPSKYDVETTKETEIVQFEETLKKSEYDHSEQLEKEIREKSAELTEHEKAIKIHLDGMFKKD